MPVNINLARRRYMTAWQLLLILLGTSWLWAPYLNPHLSARTTLISQYESVSQPYSWLFRLGDALAALLVGLLASYCLRRPHMKTMGWLLAVISAGLFLDALLATTCRANLQSCQEYFSLSFLLHAIETSITSTTFFVIAVYDAWLRKKLVSITFAVFQVGYGLLFVTQLANQQHFNTISQYIYETILITWLAWFGRDYLIEGGFYPRRGEERIVKLVAAAWAFLNGILAILLGLSHINLLGRIRAFYFAGDNAWLAQHGVIIGVVLLYISRHLARGEIRARQIFLAIAGIETLKYSVISPDPALMLLYLLTFVALFVFREDFDRGTIPLTWRLRFKELLFMIAALLVAALAALLSLGRNNHVALVTGRAFDNFFDYVVSSDIVKRANLKSALLAHTISAFFIAGVAAILWILFKPSKIRSVKSDYARVEQVVRRFSNSSEDFFKLWPPDKNYFWQKDQNGFVAYRQIGPVIFGLADPITSSKRYLLDEFISWSKAHRLKVCFLPVYESSLSLYQKAGLETIQMGSSAVIDTQKFLAETANDKWWRWKRNRAEKSGYTYQFSAPPHSSDLLKQLKRVSDAWLTRDGRVERGFALGYFDASYMNRCELHYLLDQSGEVAAFTNQIPQFGQPDRFTVDLLRFLPEADDAMPYLLYKTIFSTADREKYKYFDLGFVPFAKAKGPIMTIAKIVGAGRFSASGLEQFKNKFDPDWQPNYLAYEGDLADLAQIALNLEKATERTTG